VVVVALLVVMSSEVARAQDACPEPAFQTLRFCEKAAGKLGKLNATERTFVTEVCRQSPSVANAACASGKRQGYYESPADACEQVPKFIATNVRDACARVKPRFKDAIEQSRLDSLCRGLKKAGDIFEEVCLDRFLGD
jgi:hypothetical protein